LGTAADIAYEVLFIGVDLLDLAPVPGLRPAARLLLNIWNSAQIVDVSFMPRIATVDIISADSADERTELFAANCTMRRHPHLGSRGDF
jgi:hypothetical protein